MPPALAFVRAMTIAVPRGRLRTRDGHHEAIAGAHGVMVISQLH